MLSDHELQRLLAEDAPYGDLTTASLGIGACPARIRFFARKAMIACATEEAARLLELAGGAARLHCPSGTAAAADALLLEARGPAAALHRAWKVAQTLMEYASGIAAATARIVAAVAAAGFDTPVACTRKNFPGTKAIAARAVVAGGGILHRLGLSETLLVFPEHRAFIPDAELAAALAALKRRCPEKKLVAEVNGVEDALRLAALGAEVIQLEKLPPEAVAQCRRALRERGLAPLLACAGGINEGNAAAYAAAGAELLVTSAPYFAGPMDVQVRLEAATP